MSKLEIACVIIGFITLFNSSTVKGNITTREMIAIMIKETVRIIVSGCMILLPLYFRLWKG